MDAAGRSRDWTSTKIIGAPLHQESLDGQDKMTLAPLLAPQSKMAKARKTRAANATLRDFNEPNWLGGAISLACFKLSFTYKNLLDALTSTFCIVFVKVSSRQRSVQVKPHFMKSTGCEV